MEQAALIFCGRAAAYIAVTLLLSLFSPHLLFEGAGFEAPQIFLVISIVTFGQALISHVRNSETSVFALFLADSAVAMLLVRASGSSTSPFLVLFPLLSLAGAVLFRPVLVSILAVFSIGLMSIAVGFGVAILGNTAAILATTALGLYLMRTLRSKDSALSASEVARRRLENLQKAILTNIPSGLVSVDSQGRIIQVNGVGVRILGVRESDVLFRPLKSLLPEIERQISHLTTLVPTASAPEAATDRPTVRYRRPDTNEELQLGYSVARLTDPEDRSLLGSLLVFQDLTNVMKLEENLRLSEKLAAVGKLAAGIAHEIRNPLAGISGSAQLLSSLTDLGEEDQRLLDIIQRESARLDSLINDFLEYVRPSKLKVETVDLTATVVKLIENMRVNPRWLKHACELELVGSPGPILVEGDANRITQVLMNFVLNSGQAGAKRAEFRLSADGRLELRDSGPGIPAEIRSRIFEPFFTTKESGTGLGLAISYKVLEALGAHVEVVSPTPDFCPTGGTMFRIEFRIAKGGPTS